LVRVLIGLAWDAVGANESLGIDLVVTTYDAYLAEQSWLKRAFVWRYVILDEGHKVKVSFQRNIYKLSTEK
jgi:SWI/SNF-related matrix-associated actin-dependent regulator of chromatin subfamily A member 5